MSAAASLPATPASRAVPGPVQPHPDGAGPSRAKTTWAALSVYDYDAELRCTTRHVYGYVMRCTCGERGKVRRTVHAVRADVRQHEAEHRA